MARAVLDGLEPTNGPCFVCETYQFPVDQELLRQNARGASPTRASLSCRPICAIAQGATEHEWAISSVVAGMLAPVMIPPRRAMVVICGIVRAVTGVNDHAFVIVSIVVRRIVRAMTGVNDPAFIIVCIVVCGIVHAVTMRLDLRFSTTMVQRAIV